MRPALLPIGLAWAALAVGAVGTTSAAPEPAVQRSVHEDDGARIEELRVRGLNHRLLVRPKAASAPAYEIVPADPGHDATTQQRSAGRARWQLFTF